MQEDSREQTTNFVRDTSHKAPEPGSLLLWRDSGRLHSTGVYTDEPWRAFHAQGGIA